MKDDYVKLTITPINLDEANAYVEKYHRHHKPVIGAKFAIAASNPYLSTACRSPTVFMIRVYSEMTGCEVNCFETMAQAHAWIAANEVAAG